MNSDIFNRPPYDSLEFETFALDVKITTDLQVLKKRETVLVNNILELMSIRQSLIKLSSCLTHYNAEMDFFSQKYKNQTNPNPDKGTKRVKTVQFVGVNDGKEEDGEEDGEDEGIEEDGEEEGIDKNGENEG